MPRRAMAEERALSQLESESSADGNVVDDNIFAKRRRVTIGGSDCAMEDDDNDNNTNHDATSNVCICNRCSQNEFIICPHCGGHVATCGSSDEYFMSSSPWG